MPAYPNELQSVIARELSRLCATAKDVEAHLEDALGSDTLQETTITGIQQIDEIAQVLEQLAALLSHASMVAPMQRENAALLIDVVKLTSLQHRLQGTCPSGGVENTKSEDIEFF